MSTAPATDLVASYLSNGAVETYKRTLLVKYVFLFDELREKWLAASGVVDYIESNLAPLKSLSVQNIVEDGTPFFWMNIDRCRTEPDSLASSSRHLVMLAFDSFFPHLLDGAEFKLSPVEGSDVVLPKLGIRVPASGKPALLRRLNAESLEIEVNSETETFTLGQINEKYALPLMHIPGHDSALLMQAKDPSLQEDAYIETISLNQTAAVSLNQKIGRALEWITEADPIWRSDQALHQMVFSNRH